MKNPHDYLYGHQHMWAREIAPNIWQAGITHYAQDLLGDIVFIELPQVGAQIKLGQACGVIESVKTGSDLIAPLSGEIIKINADLQDALEMINDKPYKAWMIEFKPSNAGEFAKLLSHEAYEKEFG